MPKNEKWTNYMESAWQHRMREFLWKCGVLPSNYRSAVLPGIIEQATRKIWEIWYIPKVVKAFVWELFFFFNAKQLYIYTFFFFEQCQAIIWWYLDNVFVCENIYNGIRLINVIEMFEGDNYGPGLQVL